MDPDPFTPEKVSTEESHIPFRSRLSHLFRIPLFLLSRLLFLVSLYPVLVVSVRPSLESLGGPCHYEIQVENFSDVFSPRATEPVPRDHRVE